MRGAVVTNGNNDGTWFSCAESAQHLLCSGSNTLRKPRQPVCRQCASPTLSWGNGSVQEHQAFRYRPDGTWRMDRCRCGGECGGKEHNATAAPAGVGAAAWSPPASSAGSQDPASGAGDGWTGYSPGVTVEPAEDDRGKPDSCKSIITLHLWLDGAKSNANGCPENYLGSGRNRSDIDLDGELFDARRILEGRRFACPCKQPPGRKCWLEFRIKVHTNQDGDGPGGPTPIPVEFDCGCPKRDVDPGPGVQFAYDPPGMTSHPPGPVRVKICWPPLPTAPHTMAHEIMHALGLGLGMDMYTGAGTPQLGWRDTLMGDPYGTGVTQRDICAIAKANKACRVPGKRGKKDTLCCDEYDDTVIGVDKKAIPAESVQIAQAPTTGSGGTVVLADTGQLAAVLHTVLALTLGTGSSSIVSAWE